MSALARLRESVVVCGPRVITAGHGLAAAAGAASYSRGGNAFDAALAASFMEHVALPMKCGLAGDLVALFRQAGGEFRALLSIGSGARALADGARLENVGPRSVGIPGAPHGYSVLHALARLPLDDLVADAKRASHDGVPWTRLARSYLVEAASLLAAHSPKNPYAPDGRIPEVGELRRLPGLGDLLSLFVHRREALFEGPLGKRLAGGLGSVGGFIVEEDFAQRPARITEPLCSDIGDGSMLTVTPAPTHGPSLLEVLLATSVGADLVSAIRAVRARRAAAGREPADDGTSVVTAADNEGNAVIVVHSNSFPQFASGIVTEEGLVLNNRPGRGFDLKAPPGAANAPAAGKTPWTTLHAWCLRRGGGIFIGGTPGGVNQVPWNAQMLSELMRGDDIADIVTAPRWSLSALDVLAAEPNAACRADAQPLEEFGLRAAQQVVELGDPLHRAAADPRVGACAIAVY